MTAKLKRLKNMECFIKTGFLQNHRKLKKFSNCSKTIQNNPNKFKNTFQHVFVILYYFRSYEPYRFKCSCAQRNLSPPESLVDIAILILKNV